MDQGRVVAVVMGDTAREVLTVLITAASSSGLAAAWFNRRSHLERESALEKQSEETDKLKAEVSVLVMKTLRDELEAEQADAADRRKLILEQSAELVKQANLIHDQQRTIADHESTLMQFTLWAEWVVRILRERGISVPNPPHLPDHAADSVHGASLLSELASGND